MRLPTRHSISWLCLFAALPLVQCTKADPPPSGDFGVDGGGTGGLTGGAGAGGADVLAGASGASGSDQAGFGGEDCGGEAHEAKLAPLSLVFMVDQSGSMAAATASGGTKWEAVTAALDSFLSGTDAQELFASLQYFPYFRENVPTTCSRTSECNGFGPCVTPKICTNHYFAGRVVDCETADDCVDGNDVGQCLPRGGCAGEAGLLCVPEFEPVCRSGLGDCLQADSECAERRSCDPADYANPAVLMGPRATVAGPIVSSLNAASPSGATPTGPALAGALNYAKAWRSAHPEHKVAAVLVTDGLPTDCAVTDINAIAGYASAEAPTILTFVIGVFEDELAQTAQTNLDALAQSGGTDAAVVVSTSSNVAEEIGAALAGVRESIIACEYEIPDPTTGELAYDYVNVDFAHGVSDPTPLAYVETAAECASVTNGWYYDVEPSLGTPALIKLCSQTCASLQGDDSASVRVRLGCPTVIH